MSFDAQLRSSCSSIIRGRSGSVLTFDGGLDLGDSTTLEAVGSTVNAANLTINASNCSCSGSVVTVSGSLVLSTSATFALSASTTFSTAQAEVSGATMSIADSSSRLVLGDAGGPNGTQIATLGPGPRSPAPGRCTCGRG